MPIGLACLPFAFRVVMLAACSSTATMGQIECSAVGWRTIGHEDDIAGRSGSQIDPQRHICVRYGITPDLEAHRLGCAKGLREFCRPHNGYRAGVTGTP
jgi:Protein of unknown function (DUF2799)